MKEQQKIRRMVVDGVGEVLTSNGLIDDYQAIEPFTVNGEMAAVTWYRQGNREFNGEYVIEIEYEK